MLVPAVYTILQSGLRIFPGPARYALMISVFAAVIAIAGSFFSSPASGVLATIVAILLVILILLFVTASGLGVRLGLPAVVFVWFVLALFIAFSSLMLSAFFFKYPEPVDVLMARIFNSPIALAAPTASAEIEKTGEISVSELPEVMLRPISLAQDKVATTIALAEKGSLKLNRARLVVGQPGQGKNVAIFMHTLELMNDSVVVTNGNKLTIVAYEVVSSSGRILSFEEPDAAPHQLGTRGLPGGSVTIVGIKGILGNLQVNLPGQAGAAGTQGSAGANGAAGDPGTPSSSSAFDCKRGGGTGGRGHNGAPGGQGTPGAAGGDGGELLLSGSIDRQTIAFAAPGGRGGGGGPGGPGGRGGPGGPGGRGSTFCHGGQNGPPGVDGPAGQKGDDGVPGAAGGIIIQTQPMT